MFKKLISNNYSRCQKKLFSTLVIADHKNSKLSPSFLNILQGSQQLNQETHVLVTGQNLQNVTNDLQNNFSSKYFSKILSAEHQDLTYNFPDRLEHVIKNVIEQNKYTHVITSTSTSAKDFLPRLAAQFDSQAITDIITVHDGQIFERPIYAGNAICKVKSSDSIKFLALRATSFEPVQVESKDQVNVEQIDVNGILSSAENSQQFVQYVKDQMMQSDKPELTAAKIIVSGGRGMKSKENFEILEKLADIFGNAAVGASRAAVDAGFVSNDLQVGQTGKVVAPDLYVAVGISGAIQHIAGMKDSKVIVAINKDPEAPIFQISNYGLVGDLFKIIPELSQKLEKSAN